MDTKYNTNQHSVYLLQYHLILVVKYRRKVLNDDVCKRLKEIFEYIATNPKYSLKIIEFNHDIDHLHILFEAEPKSELVKFINAYKTASSRLIKQEFQHIKKYLWREYFWSRSYFLATTGGVSLEVLKKYVENQGVKEKGENLDKRTKAYRNL